MAINKKNRNPVFDRSIWMTLGVVSLIGLFITGYKYFTFHDCSAANFIIEDESLTVGKIISFADTTSGASNWKWTFGDDSEIETNKEAIHVFKHPGTYNVRLQVDDGCTIQKEIVIRESKKIVNTSRYPVFSMPSSAYVGDRVRFTDHTHGAEKWEWSFGETMQIDATSKSPSYIFKSPGKKTITLTVNDKDQYATKKRLTVFAKPVKKPKLDIKPHNEVEIKRIKPKDTVIVSKIPVAPPLQPKQENNYPELNRIQLEDYLLQVSEEKRKPATLKPFFCSGYNTRVRVNGEENTLQTLLQQLKGRKVSIQNLEVVKNKQTKCINYIKIDFKKDKLFGIF